MENCARIQLLDIFAKSSIVDARGFWIRLYSGILQISFHQKYLEDYFYEKNLSFNCISSLFIVDYKMLGSYAFEIFPGFVDPS